MGLPLPPASMHPLPLRRALAVAVLLVATTGARPRTAPRITPRAPDPCAPVHADTVHLALRFEVDARDTAAPVVVTLELAAMRDTSVLLRLPNSWAGRSRLYENIVNLTAATPGARIVPTDSAARVRLVARKGRPVTITWRLRATARSYTSDEAHNHSDIGTDWAQIVGYDAMVLPALQQETPLHATLRFRGLGRGAAIGTSFGTPGADSTITARGTLGDLRRAVYTMAISPSAIRAYTSTVSGGALTILIRGRHAIDDSTLRAGVERVMGEERRFWGTLAPPHYLVTIGVAPRGGLDGVRLANTFVADIDSTFTMNERVQGLFAHELMHEWVGTGVLHPSCAVHEGDLYWFTEGFDDFMSHRLMHAAGLLSDTGYAAAVNRDLSEHALSTVRDSSWEAVVRGFWRDAALQRQPYARGELIALTLNAELARATHGRTTLDTLLRQLARKPRSELAGGLTAPLIYRELGTTLGADKVQSIVERLLAGGAITLPDDALGACMTPTMVQRGTWDAGFDLTASLAAKRVLGVHADGPAAKAGLRDSLPIVSLRASRGDASRPIDMRVVIGKDTTPVRYLPAVAPFTTVQQWSVTPGCSANSH